LKRPSAGRRHWAPATHTGSREAGSRASADAANTVLVGSRTAGESLDAVACLSLVFERFTESAREVVVSAQEAARELGHAHIGSEHQLLGLLADPDSDASGVLESPGVTANRAREGVIEIVPRGDQRFEGFLPFTPGAKKVFELSLREALGLGHRSITPEHLLLGLAHERDGVAMQVLVGLGADETAIRAAVMPVLAARIEAGPQIPRASQPLVDLVEMFPSDPGDSSVVDSCRCPRPQ
jgi:hypothetical protein